jgi:hypothetical protein
MSLSRRLWLAGAVAIPGAAVGAYGWSRRRRSARPASVVHEAIVGERRVIRSNAVPEHPMGDFPNSHDPVGLRAQQLRFEMPARPQVADAPRPLGMWQFGVAINGVPFDPSGPFWKADGNSGWQFEVMCPANAVALGIDVNHAHTQGRGTYHYHGLPTGLLWSLRRKSPGAPMLLLGHAADGFPIYGPDAPASADDLGSPARRLRSSHRLRSGRRNGGPGGRFDGTFVEDFAYEPGLGDLDECNGRVGPTPEYPEGTYYYVLTDDFPYVPRLYRGEPDATFKHGPPPGVSPPLPRELRAYRGT